MEVVLGVARHIKESDTQKKIGYMSSCQILVEVYSCTVCTQKAVLEKSVPCKSCFDFWLLFTYDICANLV